MTTFVVGGTGQTGRHLVDQLLERGERVKAVVRPDSKIPRTWNSNELLEIIPLELTRVTKYELAGHLEGCRAIGSCLGHRTIYGSPRYLVRDAVRLLCDAVSQNTPARPVRFILMNTAGYHVPDSDPPLTFLQKVIIRLLRVLLPPHPDNEKAAEYLIHHTHEQVEWVVVRPDNLTTEEAITPYSIHPAPTRDPFFKPGKSSRINVAHFMASLITEESIWDKWKGRMPVIYNE
ncbi:MAG TPA: NAD(P)-binding oxidoreductase [Membranihabitans sp.]|nr:NAD(P)-binding oxidoreductase [Membranihabitans sp.]